MYGLLKRGYKIQPFKIGPDYIDPSYHNALTKRYSKNLDVWLMGKKGVIECFVNSTDGTDFAVLEGVMGLFDGLSGKNNYASTAHISKILGIPIILIVDARKAARSLAAITLGFLKFDRTIRISGIIINHIASERHSRYISEAFESKIKVPIIGKIYNTKNKEATLQERHLGLIPTEELDSKNIDLIIKNSKTLCEYIDIEKIIEIGKKNNTNYQNYKKIKSLGIILKKNNTKENLNKIKISIALDKSFNFYYKDNLDIIQKKTNVEFFSPLDDNSISQDSCGMIIGGGFPEVIADKLEKNNNIKKQILRLAEDNMPIYAECGGLMYLTKSISGYNDKDTKYKMIGLFDADTIMTKKLTLGYTEAVLKNSKTVFGKIKRIRGHEFHYSKIITNNKDLELVYALNRGNGIVDGKDGFFLYDCIASYMHTHFINSNLSENFLKRCVNYSKR